MDNILKERVYANLSNGLLSEKLVEEVFVDKGLSADETFDEDCPIYLAR